MPAAAGVPGRTVSAVHSRLDNRVIRLREGTHLYHISGEHLHEIGGDRTRLRRKDREVG